jgi:hypothetical protein
MLLLLSWREEEGGWRARSFGFDDRFENDWVHIPLGLALRVIGGRESVWNTAWMVDKKDE